MESSSGNLIVEKLYEETKKRLDEMERKDYEFPEKIGGADIAVIVAMITVSIVLTALCMIGVIK